MNLTVLLIAAYLPLPVVIFMILRSGSFGRGSAGTLLKLFFLGVAAAVPAFLMEAGSLLVINIFLRLFAEDAFGGKLPVISAILRSLIAAALIEEGWKHFVLRTTTWQQMTMETVADGIAASAVVGTGFSTILYGAWQAAYRLIPAGMEVLRGGMPDWLRAGAAASILFSLLFIFSHFGFSGFMGAVYGIAKRSEQKEHGGRAGFMLFVSFLLPVLAHGFCAALIGYGIDQGKVLWLAVGFAAEVMLALLMAAQLNKASDVAVVDGQHGYANGSAGFPEASGSPVDDRSKSGDDAEETQRGWRHFIRKRSAADSEKTDPEKTDSERVSGAAPQDEGTQSGEGNDRDLTHRERADGDEK